MGGKSTSEKWASQFRSFKMIVTDLDGTLLSSENTLSPKNRDTLKRLGEEGITRVVATGRNLYSAKKVLNSLFPIDYLIFSSGVGILDLKENKILMTHTISSEELDSALDVLKKKKLNFMIHAPAPENHFCLYSEDESILNENLKKRVSLYQEFAAPFSSDSKVFTKWGRMASTVVISVVKSKGEAIVKSLKRELPSLHIVRCTSPIDENYLWIELLPLATSKGKASEWLKCYLNESGPTMGIGNDYNDVDLLHWADHSFVVDNAPFEMKEHYQTVPSNNDSGFSLAVAKFLKR